MSDAWQLRVGLLLERKLPGGADQPPLPAQVGDETEATPYCSHSSEQPRARLHGHWGLPQRPRQPQAVRPPSQTVVGPALGSEGNRWVHLHDSGWIPFATSRCDVPGAASVNVQFA